ncbi:copper homeostasis protein CutC [Paenibacillus sp. sgz500958]|uniref:copper homeostasis protein CutC n=1 Tax=Paenibacillus sp. sgz500958 TaxID=3242475 RepID=UPI0036D41E0B
MLLEVIATTLGDAVTAERGGADRIELITGILEGGLTPSLALIEKVREAVSIPVRVMVRPHARSFQYDAGDLEVMKRDIEHISSVGGLGVVLGVLDSHGEVDEVMLNLLLDAAAGLEVTFHRAIDEVHDQGKALTILSRYPQITDVLTSGGCRTAPEGADRLAELNSLAAGSSISILAGAGLNADALESFLRQTGISRVHFGSAVRVDGDPLKPVDLEKVREIRRILDHSTRREKK